MMHIGILVDATEVPAWQSELIRLLRDTDYITTHLLLIEDAHNKSARRDPGSFFQQFERYERSRNKTLPDASAIKPIDTLINEKDWIRISLNPSYEKLSLKSTAPHNLSKLQLDVILAIGGLDSVDNFRQASKYGIWYFSHGYGQTAIADGSTVGFWETFKRRPYIHSALVTIHAPERGNLIALESRSGIHHKSFFQSRNEHLWKILFFVPRALEQMYSKGPEQYFSDLNDRIETESTRVAKRRYHLSNTNLILSLSLYFAWRVWQKVIQNVYAERWMLLFSLSANTDDISKFNLLRPPDGRFWADPHVTYHKDDYYIFFEDASVKSGHGHIAVIQLDSDGNASLPKAVLEKPYHLSYPFVFKWEDQIYMIPESAANRSVELYRCVEFPLRWEFMHNLMHDVLAYDSTLVHHDGLWWLFANVKQHTGTSSWDELCLFYSNTPISNDWTPHPMNPIISDVRSARPAGAFFKKDGDLYRPSQDSSNRYGYALKVNKVIKLTKTVYVEETMKSILPDKDRSIRGIHTINRANNLVVIDAIYRLRCD